VLHCTYNIPPPTNIKNLFGRWFNGIDKNTKERVRVGVCALIWAMLNYRNDVIFNNAGHDQFLQVMHRTTSWIHMHRITSRMSGNLWILDALG
jgi:hypothetical protein